jgi:hypothetical protein
MDGAGELWIVNIGKGGWRLHPGLCEGCASKVSYKCAILNKQIKQPPLAS